MRSTSRSPSLLSTDQRDRADSAEPTERTDPAEKADRVEPTDATDNAEPTEPMLSADPAEPIDRIDPRLAIERNESSDHNDNPPMPGIVACTHQNHAKAHHLTRPRLSQPAGAAAGGES
ncbi:hypothetical protein [Kribbella sp. VKM Ac-2568]|uniref:hypothetical protein n=1 Tax=Kribbella sp. VKM Ac-2568 TaxID=2512219 RepID=UPI0013050ADF|nr:hypothetical protein [Kribbella sp. VKM Ac-2568]